MALLRATWSREKMILAVLVERNKEYGYLKASKLHNVPSTTLKRYVQKANKESLDPKDESLIKDLILGTNLGRNCVLTKPLEDELVPYCLKMESTYFGLRRKDIRRLAFQLAIRNNIKHTFSTKNNTAGKKWLWAFLNRHPNLSFRRPQRISVARAQAFMEENVAKFFSVLKLELKKINYKPSCLFNVDETGITIVQHSSQKVLTVKGKRDVHKLLSAERGGLITVVMCMSASWIFIPPMVIYPCKNRKDELANDLPAESMVGYSPSGWITSQLFTQWFAKFIEAINANETNPAVLVFDGHFTHTRNLDIINLARENNVSLVSLLPHTSGKTQPLDVSFMKAFKSYYSAAIEDWMDSHEGRMLTHYSIGKLFTSAFEQSATIRIAKKGFEETGIFPYNANVFENDPKFIKNVTNPHTPTKVSSPSTSHVNPPTPMGVRSSLSTSHVFPPTPTRVRSSSSTSHVSPEDIHPVPQLAPAPPSKRRQKATVISASPHKILSSGPKRSEWPKKPPKWKKLRKEI